MFISCHIVGGVQRGGTAVIVVDVLVVEGHAILNVAVEFGFVGIGGGVAYIDMDVFVGGGGVSRLKGGFGSEWCSALCGCIGVTVCQRRAELVGQRDGALVLALKERTLLCEHFYTVVGNDVPRDVALVELLQEPVGGGVVQRLSLVGTQLERLGGCTIVVVVVQEAFVGLHATSGGVVQARVEPDTHIVVIEVLY